MRLLPVILATPLLGLLVLAQSCGCSTARASTLPPPASRFKAEAERRLSRLSLEEKCGQLLLVGVARNSSSSGKGAADYLGSVAPGGILLFGFNADAGPEALAGLVSDWQAAAAASPQALPLIVAIDHEGGSVFRFKSGLTRLPAPAVVGERGAAYASLLGKRAGLELEAIGVNLALAPVVETLTPQNKDFLGGRSYGADATRVDHCAGAFIEGLAAAGVASAAKHFPGNAGVDPHRGLPVLDLDRKTLEKAYLDRFRSAIDHGAGAVLLSHVLVPSVDPSNPATLSSAFVGGLLKTELRFDGVALTDDLFMKALSGDGGVEKAAIAAVKAGADLLMLSDGHAGPKTRGALVAAVKSGLLDASRIDDAASRIIELKLRFGMSAALDPATRANRLAALPSIVAESALLLGQPAPGGK